MRTLPVIAITALLLNLSSSDPWAAVQSSASPTDLDKLDGWGAYKFGMTADQARRIGAVELRVLPKLMRMNAPDFSFSMGSTSSDLNEFGLHPWTALLDFDGQRQLSRIHLVSSRGGLTVDGCKARFVSLLTNLEAQYGMFQPGDEPPWNPNGAASEKADFTVSLPGGHSQYREVVRSHIQGPSYNLDTKIYRATAKRLYGARSIEVDMSVIDDPHSHDPYRKISEAELALAPNLANPLCMMNIDYTSKSPLLPRASSPDDTTPASTLPTSSGNNPSEQLHNLQSTINQGAPPSKIQEAFQGFMDAAKKDGLVGPIDPVLDAYIEARAVHDDEDTQALLAKMGPAQLALAAYIRHDYPLAIKLWTPLAEKGDIEAAASIGSLYEGNLNGVTQDYAQAAKWLRLAASEGDDGSQEAIGELYANGQGVPKNNLRAYMWFSVSLGAATDGPGKNWFPALIAKKREAVAVQMSPEEIGQAVAMAARCTESHYKECD